MKKFYVTTSIVYTNAPPHIGFALELVQADVLARYHRSLNEDVFFLTGTDEHGLKIAKAAEEAGREPKKFVDEIAKKCKELTDILNISNDDFIRTTDRKKHWPVVEKVWLKLKENKDIYKKKYKGFYCAGCEAFITKKDLVNGKCPNHLQEPELVEEENYFFRLSKYADDIKKALETDKIKIVPESRKKEIIEIIKQGLGDISFSRSIDKLKWGIPVPDDNSQTIYVWADALVNYISELDYPNGRLFKKYWPADVHCIGKDIFKFHALIWPGILLSLGLPLPKTIFIHGFISVAGKKMSKSLGNVIDPFELVKKYGSTSSPQVGTDAVRYYLLREISPTEDGDFTYEKFEKRYNADLAGGIGNLVARVCSLGEKVGFKEKSDKKIKSEIEKTKRNYKKALGNFRFNEALKSIWNLIGFSDRYIDKEKPWENKENSSEVIGNLLVVLDNIAELLKPFLPETAEKILKEIARSKKTGKFKIKTSKALFPRI